MDKGSAGNAARAGMPGRKNLKNWVKSYTGQKYITTVIFLLIPVTLLVVFTFVPMVEMFVFSFQSRDMFGINPEWVGFKNYMTVFTDPTYVSTLKTSLYYMVGSFIQLTVALFIAQLLCFKIRLNNVYKGIIFFPYMMNGVAVSLIFRRFFQKGDGVTNTEGTFNSILSLFGVEPVRWFMENPFIANCCLVFASIWRYIGFDIIMFIAAIMAVSPEILEASEIEGANGWQRFRYIIFPGIRPIVAIQLILAIKGAVSVFEIPYVITLGKLGTNTFVIQTMSTAFESKKVGLGSAMGIVLLAIIIIITLIQKAFFKEEK
jgi:multiple sugar transport system permease protein